MSKGLRVAATIVGVAALAVVTYGAGLAIAGSAASLSAGIAAAGTAIGVSASTLALVSSGLAMASALAQKRPSQTGNPTQFTADPHAPVPYMMGRLARDALFRAWRPT